MGSEPQTDEITTERPEYAPVDMREGTVVYDSEDGDGDSSDDDGADMMKRSAVASEIRR